MGTLHIADIDIEITRKKIRNLHLKVVGPEGNVRISAPLNMPMREIETFVLSKVSWIRRHQEKFRTGAETAVKWYADGEEHLFRGEQVKLKILETKGAARAVLNKKTLQLYIRGGADRVSRERLVDQFYRNFLKKEVSLYMRKYEPLMGVQVSEVGVKKMKTRWGTCNCRARRIWVNLEMAKKPPHVLEYLVVHEMVHLLEPSHNARFKDLMDLFYPEWRRVRNELKG